ncbi:MAG: hypothetical protein NTY09_00085 [bacterium]|nr:hypothetical protein [bacterium]
MTNTIITNNEELKHRILARKLELEAKLEHLKADTAGKTADICKSIQKDLDDLGSKIAQGWENLSANAVQGINDWFKQTDSY